MSKQVISYGSLTGLIAAVALSCGPAHAQMFAFPVAPTQADIGLQYERQYEPQDASRYAPQYQPQYQSAPAEQNQPGDDSQLEPRLQRQVVDYSTSEAPGTIVIDTPHTYLYYVLGGGKAMRYGIGVGREGFTWAGVQKVARKAEWPDWYPPPGMVARQPYLPRMTAGGPGNPLGARAMYLGNSEYRIHGTNNPATIGKNVSSGCIRLTNDDVTDLYERVQLGAKVVVLPQTGAGHMSQAPVKPQAAQSQPVSLSSGYGADSGARRTWNDIRPSGLY